MPWGLLVPSPAGEMPPALPLPVFAGVLLVLVPALPVFAGVLLVLVPVGVGDAEGEGELDGGSVVGGGGLGEAGVAGGGVLGVVDGEGLDGDGDVAGSVASGDDVDDDCGEGHPSLEDWLL